MRMTLIYFGILILTLYGDLLKRYVSPDLSVAYLYGMALGIILFMIVAAKRYKILILNKESKTISRCIIIIFFLYLFQLLVALIKADSFAALSNAIYICMPLLYCLIIIKFYPEFDITKFAKIFHILMIPINAVGVMQYYVNPAFMISTAYHEAGGIIERNLLEGSETFLRFPSLFTSADRYSAIGLMQCAFAFVLLAIPSTKKKLNIFWALFHLFSGVIAMFIAGARSRILIFLVIFMLLIISVISSLHKRSSLRTMRNLISSFLGGLFFVIPGLFLFVVTNPQYVQKVFNYPVINFFTQSLNEGDIANRINEAVSTLLALNEASLFGEGLGTSSSTNKPREFAITGMWMEGGLIFGGLTLIAYMSIVFILILTAFKAFYKGEPSKVVIFAFPALVLNFGLFTGLTGVLELSSGVLLMVFLGSTIKYSNAQLSSLKPSQIRR